MGLLYGEGDLDKTIVITCRCGQDSDCNPSNAAGILFTTIGFKNLPEKYKVALNPSGKFSHTSYNFPTLVRVCEKLARQAVVNCGGKITVDDQGAEHFTIPRQKAQSDAAGAVLGTQAGHGQPLHRRGDDADHRRERHRSVQGDGQLCRRMEGRQVRQRHGAGSAGGVPGPAECPADASAEPDRRLRSDSGRWICLQTRRAA